MHDHHHHHHHHSSTGNILIAFGLNFSFALIELVGGYLTNSIAIYSDALHDLGDSLSLLLAYYGEKMGVKDADSRFTFGYKRFSILSALVNCLVLLAGSVYIIYEAIQRFLQPEVVDAKGMLLLAILGVAVNGFAAYRMSKNEGFNSKMVTYHLLEDILGWVAVLIVSTVLMFKPWYLLDSVLSIIVSLIILKSVFKYFLKIVRILLQQFPDQLEMESIKKEILKVFIVKDIHAIKGWSIDEDSFYLRFHIVVPDATTIEEIDKSRKAIKSILAEHKVDYSTIEFESASSCQ